MLKEKKNAMKRLEQAFTYINDHYCEKITLEEVAASVYMSSNYFFILFSQGGQYQLQRLRDKAAG